MDPYTIYLIITLALTVAAYLLTPKPKAPKPPEAEDFENPTADAGRSIPEVIGDVRVKGLNVMWFGDKGVVNRKVKA